MLIFIHTVMRILYYKHVSGTKALCTEKLFLFDVLLIIYWYLLLQNHRHDGQHVME